jgi:hypothetical protein
MTAIVLAVNRRSDSRSVTRDGDSSQLARMELIGTNTEAITIGQKNGGHVKRGGTLQCPPVRSGRPRTLRTESGWWEEHPTRGCQSRLHPIIETIQFSDYSKEIIQVKKNICTRVIPD